MTENPDRLETYAVYDRVWDALGNVACLIRTRRRHAWDFRRVVSEVSFPDDWTAGDPAPPLRQFVAENCKHCGVEREVTE